MTFLPDILQAHQFISLAVWFVLAARYHCMFSLPGQDVGCNYLQFISHLSWSD
jgi:hypothetical protein